MESVDPRGRIRWLVWRAREGWVPLAPLELEVVLLSKWLGKLCQRLELDLEFRASSPYLRFLKPTM